LSEASRTVTSGKIGELLENNGYYFRQLKFFSLSKLDWN